MPSYASMLARFRLRTPLKWACKCEKARRSRNQRSTLRRTLRRSFLSLLPFFCPFFLSSLSFFFSLARTRARDGTRTIFSQAFARFARARKHSHAHARVRFCRLQVPRLNFTLPVFDLPILPLPSLLHAPCSRHLALRLSPASRNGNVPRAMKMIKRHPESPGKAALIRHQRQNQRHRRCCNSRVNSPPLCMKRAQRQLKRAPAYYRRPSETVKIFLPLVSLRR